MKKLAWIGCILVLLGVALCVVSAARADFDWEKLSTVPLAAKTYGIDQQVTAIVVESEEGSVRLLPAGDGECRAVCTENENGSLRYDVSVSDGVLSVQARDQRRWYERIGIFIADVGVELYLPQGDYEGLTVRTSSGSVHVTEDFSFDQVQLESSSGSVNFSAGVEGALAVKTSSGRVSLTNVTCASLNAQTSSGGIRLTDVIALDTLHAQSSSGSVRLTRCDGATLNIRTSSGSVSGTLLSDKVFLTDTSSGSINVPRTVTGGVCEVTTSSGSIKLAYEN